MENQTGNYVDPEWEKTRTDCIPESDTKLSCIVEGATQPGFSDDAVTDAAGSFQIRWEVIVDPATGRFQARQVN